MMTVHEVAEHYGVSDAFMVRALAKIGFRHAKPETALPTPTVARFEAEFGNKIRAARPKPQPAFTAESDAAPTASRAVRKPTPHVMRVAHARVTGTRLPNGMRVKALLADPGPVHAIDAAGTRDGDPWRGEVVPGAVHFYGGSTNSGPTAACGWMHLRVVLGDEFVPADDPARAGQCPRCAALVAEGMGFRDPPDPYGYRSAFCDAYLRLRVDGSVSVKDCSLRDFHDGPHRARDGAEWGVGVDDYVPSPDEVGCRITRAS